MNFKKLPDTPWHIGYVTKDEDDPRRHKARCVYNDGDKCNNPNMLKCISSSHCKYYAEDWDTAERFKASMKIDYKGAGVTPIGIGEALYGRKTRIKNPSKKTQSKISDSSCCPVCGCEIPQESLDRHYKRHIRKIFRMWEAQDFSLLDNKNILHCPYCNILFNSTKKYLLHFCIGNIQEFKADYQKILKSNKSKKERRSVCFNCKNYDNDICLVTKRTVSFMAHCLFYKITS